MIGIERYGAYVPKFLLERKQIADAWDFPAIPGGVAVSNADEDALTMAVEAGLDCLGKLPTDSVDGLIFATTTPPYTEKQNASVIAEALDLEKDITTMDITDSTRASTSAVARAFEMIRAGSAKRVLVVGSDTRTPMPESMYEYQYGDGAAALLVGSEDVALSIEAYTSVADNVTGPWKRAKDKYIRQHEIKHEILYGFATNTVKAFKKLLAEQGVDPKSVKKAAYYAPDPRTGASIGRRIGFSDRSIQDSLFLEIGNTGNAFPIMLLILALKRGKTGDLVAFGGYGDGADAFLMKVQDKGALMRLRKGCRGVAGYKNSMEVLKNYTSYLAKKEKLEKERFTRKSTPVRTWRDSKFLWRLYGMKCQACGTVQYPIWRACIECGAKDQWEAVKMAKVGTIFTYTLDHLVGGEYFVTPVPRCVIDLDGGGRILCDMTDCDPHDVKIGMKVELTFRKMHEGANFINYYWKCRPIRVGGEAEVA
ncbi:MAG: OB-fold domain-containing protein [Promethearchaeota archaeon]